jgi:hypothetical protein
MKVRNFGAVRNLGAVNFLHLFDIRRKVGGSEN